MAPLEKQGVPLVPLWREEPRQTETVSPIIREKLRRCLPWVAAGLFFLGGLAGILSWLSKDEKPHLVPGWMTAFNNQRLSTLAAAQNDQLLLVNGNFFHGHDLLNPAFGQRSALQRRLAELREFSKTRSVVFYISGYAGIDQHGEVYCLPSDSNPDLESDRLPLRELLCAVQRCPSREKLVILDISWPIADPRLGMVNSLVLTQARTLLEEIPDPHRLVLTSAADGQASLVSEELGQSIFGYYLLQGLRGRADGFNPQHIQDGRVSTHELASFVQSHVSRWARLNRETEQVPLFIGQSPEFDLAAVSLAVGEAWPEAPRPLKYPDWLKKGWAIYDQWGTNGYRESHPRIYQQWEMTLRRCEEQWRLGVRKDTMQADLDEYRKRLEARIKQQQQLIPMPTLHSLALLKASGVKPDPAAAAQLKALFSSIAEKTANQPPDKAASIREGLIGKFQDATGKTAAGPMSMVLWDYLLQLTAPSKEEILLLDRLSRAKQPEPDYAEILLLRRLAEMASSPATGDWHSATIHQATLTEASAEQATVRALTFPWVENLLDAAWQQDHDAKVLLFSRGYASWQDADIQLRKAALDLQLVIAYEEALTNAQLVLSRACLLFPEYLGNQSHPNHSASSWIAAAQIATHLAAELEPPSTPLIADEAIMRQRITDIRRQMMTLVDLNAAIQPSDITQTMTDCKQASAGPNIYLHAQQLLSLPTLTADQRADLWQAGHELSLRLLSQTMELDQKEPLVYQPPESAADAIIPSQLLGTLEGEVFGYCKALELLRVSGLSETKLTPVYKTSRQFLRKVQASTDPPSESDAVSLANLSDQVRDLWFVDLPNEMEKAADLAKQVRLARLIPPYALNPVLDVPAHNPLVKLRAAMHRQRWAWIAERYQYAGKDVLGPEFYAESARDYAAAAGPMPEARFMQLAELGTPPDVSPNLPQTSFEIGWKWYGAAPTKADGQPYVPHVQHYSPSEFLVVSSPENLPAEAPLSIDLTLSPGADQSDLAKMLGCLVQVNVAGRTYHLPVALPSLGESQTLELLLGTTNTVPANSLSLMELRPIQGTHSYFLFVRNLSPNAQDATIELLANGQVYATSAVKLAVGQTLPVVFEGKPPAPNTDLPEIELPIVLRAVDQASGAKLAERVVPCEMLSPREYLAVTNVVFDPSSPSENSLNVGVEAISLENGPPLSVKLSAPSNQIPGLVGIEGGAFVGSLPSAGSTLLLQAKNMQFTPSARQPGRFYVDVDDYPRAFVFRTMFPRQGDPIMPVEDTAPRIQLVAPAMGLAGPGFPVTIPTDSAPTGSTLDVAIGRMNGPLFQPELLRKLPSARHERIGLAPHGPKGELLAQASMRDWELQLDATGIVGQRQLRARLLDVDGTEILTVLQSIILDDSPPEQVSFISPPSKGAIKEEIELRALGMDGLSGITDVQFFTGKPVDGKIPTGAASVQADPLDAGNMIWGGKFPLPKETGRVEISVAFTNGVGLSSFATIAINVLDPAALTMGAIEGTVVEGPRPQANLDVQLIDSQGKPAKMAKTNAQGSFSFEQVQAGEYTVFVEKPASRRKSKAAVTVQAGSTSQATLSLAL